MSLMPILSPVAEYAIHTIDATARLVYGSDNAVVWENIESFPAYDIYSNGYALKDGVYTFLAQDGGGSTYCISTSDFLSFTTVAAGVNLTQIAYNATTGNYVGFTNTQLSVTSGTQTFYTATSLNAWTSNTARTTAPYVKQIAQVGSIVAATGRSGSNWYYLYNSSGTTWTSVSSYAGIVQLFNSYTRRPVYSAGDSLVYSVGQTVSSFYPAVAYNTATGGSPTTRTLRTSITNASPICATSSSRVVFLTLKTNAIYLDYFDIGGSWTSVASAIHTGSSISSLSYLEYKNGIFICQFYDGSTPKVATSADGVTWVVSSISPSIVNLTYLV